MGYDIFRTCGQEQLQWWYDLGLQTISDFREYDKINEIWQCSDFSSHGPTSISDEQLEEAIGPPPQDETIPRVGHFWMSNGTADGPSGTVFEIVGFQQQTLSP